MERRAAVMDEWVRQGATLRAKTACTDCGLTPDQIDEAIEAGRLQYRVASMHGNPWLRLLRREVEDLVSASCGERHLAQRRARAELARVDRELKRLRAQIIELERQRVAIAAEATEP